MAELPAPRLVYRAGCPDCGEREVELPAPLPAIGDDFDWRGRDYDAFRLFMLEELAARSPERQRWTPGDAEVVLVEALAAVLDQLSDMLDRVSAEAYLPTARRPESVRRLLRFIGYDAVAVASAANLISETGTEPEDRRRARRELERLWLRRPDLMEVARTEGPRAIRTQRRMVTVADHQARTEDHPLVLRATAWAQWTGSWTTIKVAVIAHEGHRLDDDDVDYGNVAADVRRFHAERRLPLPPLSMRPTIRQVLMPYVEAYRMVGQEVVLLDAVRIPVMMSLSVRIDDRYYRSEIRRAIEEVLGTGPTGFFAPGRRRFGDDLYASDVIQAVMALDGVENVCLNRFKRLGRYEDQSDTGDLQLNELEIAVCDNDPQRPQDGYWRLTLHGGIRG